eukprot:1827976-Amphidinium_carterae.1
MGNARNAQDCLDDALPPVQAFGSVPHSPSEQWSFGMTCGLMGIACWTACDNHICQAGCFAERDQ